MSTEILPPVTRPDTVEDPLAKITLSPRVFVAALASIALVVGLVLGLLPVRVSTLDTATTVRVSCGNTLGGVETPRLAASLGAPEKPVLAEYVSMCDRGIDARTLPAWTLFFGGMLGWVWLGAVRRPRKSGLE
nr:hypothetical protein [Kibdelosporangium sp. MJ126-NF4]CEL19454.1 hypothetical protein [Kibdelosporangium sp. MJ126-NF4]